MLFKGTILTIVFEIFQFNFSLNIVLTKKYIQSFFVNLRIVQKAGLQKRLIY